MSGAARPSLTGVLAVGQRLPSLDGLRGAAILMVLMHQLLVFDAAALGPIARRVAYVLDIGWVGVTLFFVLSGFLITHLLLALQGQEGALRSFYARRALRILPLSVLLVLVLVVLWPRLGTPPEPYANDHAAWYLLFASNWAEVFRVGGTALPNYWSLAVEEQFYLLWPALLARRSARQVLWLSVAVVMLGVLCRIVMVALSVAPSVVYVSTFSRIDALAAGASLAAAIRLPGAMPWLLAQRRQLAWLALAIALAGLLATYGYPRLRPIGQTLGYTVQTLAFTLWLASALAADVGSVAHQALRQRWLRSFGQYSYAIYLVHHPLHVLAGPVLREALGRLGLTGVPLMACYMVLGIAALWCIGWATWRLVEKPLLALRPGYRTAATR